jgi:hypothetical protein
MPKTFVTASPVLKKLFKSNFALIAGVGMLGLFMFAPQAFATPVPVPVPLPRQAP